MKLRAKKLIRHVLHKIGKPEPPDPLECRNGHGYCPTEEGEEIISGWCRKCKSEGKIQCNYCCANEGYEGWGYDCHKRNRTPSERKEVAEMLRDDEYEWR